MTDNADLDPAELEAAGALGGSEDPGYQWPTDPLVVKNLKHWQDPVSYTHLTLPTIYSV